MTCTFAVDAVDDQRITVKIKTGAGRAVDEERAKWNER
jgi:hypothetical protein